MLVTTTNRVPDIDLVTNSLKSEYGEPADDFALNASVRRLEYAFESLSAVARKRILDIGCGAVTGRGEVEANPRTWAPWLPRAVVALGGEAVGLDTGRAPNEKFEFHRVDLRQPHCLDFLSGESFDGINCSNLFSSPLLQRLGFADVEMRKTLRQSLYESAVKLLKPDGIIIHFDSDFYDW